MSDDQAAKKPADEAAGKSTAVDGAGGTVETLRLPAEQVINRRSRWRSSLAAVRYVSSVSRDNEVAVRDSDKATAIALLICCTIALGTLLVPQLENLRVNVVLAADVLVGLALLIVSSRILVWGAVEIAHGFGVSDLIIGLTIVAVGTSLPELASSIIAARKGEHDIALGNILGSNLFNTLAVVGIAGTIHPLAVGPEVFNRDMLVMAALTLSLFVIGYGFQGPGRINRIEGAVLLVCYVGYTAYLISTVFGGQA